MHPFEYVRAADPAQAVATVTADPTAAYLAGGTTQLDLILKDGILDPERLVDITRLLLKGISVADGALWVGAGTLPQDKCGGVLTNRRDDAGMWPGVRDHMPARSGCRPDPAGSRLRDSTRMLILVSRCLRLVLPRRVWRERCNVPATVLTVPNRVLVLCRGASP
jgi:hypothetical protein